MEGRESASSVRDAGCRGGRTGRAATVLSVFLGILLAGCKLGPKHVPPPPPALDPSYSSPFEESPSTLPHAFWWSTLQDPVLDELITQALAQNPDLREAAWRIEEARAQRRVVRGGLFPELTGDASYEFRRTSANANQFVAATPLLKGFNFYSAGLDVAWEIDLFGKLRRSLEAATADVGRARELYGAVRVSLVGEIAEHYVRIRVLQERIRLAEANRELQAKTLAIVEERLRVGLATPLDRAQAATVLYNTAALIAPLREQLKRATNRMSVLLGSSPGLADALVQSSGSLPEPVHYFGVGIPADLLRHRPDIRAAEREVAAAAARIGVAMADLFPQISITGTISVDSRLASAWFEPASIAHAVGPRFYWNILNFGRVRGNIQVQRARLEQALARYQKQVLVAVSEVEDALVGYERQKERVAQLERVVRFASEAVKLSQRQYERGLAPFVNVLDAQRELLVAQDQLAQARGDVLANLVRLYKALGGGWVEPAPMPALPPDHADVVEEIEETHGD